MFAFSKGFKDLFNEHKLIIYWKDFFSWNCYFYRLIIERIEKKNYSLNKKLYLKFISRTLNIYSLKYSTSFKKVKKIIRGSFIKVVNFDGNSETQYIKFFKINYTVKIFFWMKKKNNLIYNKFHNKNRYFSRF